MAKQPIIQRPPRYYLEFVESGERIALDQIQEPEYRLSHSLGSLVENELPGLTEPHTLYMFQWDLGTERAQLGISAPARIRQDLPGRIVAHGDAVKVGRGQFHFHRIGFCEHKQMRPSATRVCFLRPGHTGKHHDQISNEYWGHDV